MRWLKARVLPIRRAILRGHGHRTTRGRVGRTAVRDLGTTLGIGSPVRRRAVRASRMEHASRGRRGRRRVRARQNLVAARIRKSAIEVRVRTGRGRTRAFRMPREAPVQRIRLGVRVRPNRIAVPARPIGRAIRLLRLRHSTGRYRHLPAASRRCRPRRLIPRRGRRCTPMRSRRLSTGLIPAPGPPSATEAA